MEVFAFVGNCVQYVGSWIAPLKDYIQVDEEKAKTGLNAMFDAEKIVIISRYSEGKDVTADRVQKAFAKATWSLKPIIVALVGLTVGFHLISRYIPFFKDVFKTISYAFLWLTYEAAMAHASIEKQYYAIGLDGPEKEITKEQLCTRLNACFHEILSKTLLVSIVNQYVWSINNDNIGAIFNQLIVDKATPSPTPASSSNSENS